MSTQAVVLIIILLIAVVVGIGGMSPDPLDVGLQYEMEKKADIETAAAVLQREKQAKLDNLEIEVAQAAKNETISSQKITIWLGTYAKAAGVVSLAVAGSAFSLSLCIALVGFSVAFVRKANLQAELIYPDRRTLQFPVHEYSIVSTDGYKRWFVRHYGTGETARLDVTKPAEAQMIEAMAENQALAIAANSAEGVSKNTANEKQNWFVGLLKGMANTSKILEKRR